VALLDVRTTILLAALVLPAAGLLLRRRLAVLESGAGVDEEAFVLLRRLPLFAPLPVAAIESLALQTVREHHPCGAAVIEQGDVGAHFYVIEDGCAEVHRDGAFLCAYGREDFFGETALLHDAPRNATVLATAPLCVLVIERSDFLSAVGAHARSTHAARGVLAARSPAPA
jgi:CRP-like cAMP-binding protein